MRTSTDLEPPRPAAGTASPDPLAGSKYRARRELARGGWGIVYEAVHVALGRCFAVKVLRAEVTHDRLVVERMRVEAQALAQLQSRHIVEACDFGHTHDGRPFLVMPLLSGRTLVEELRKRRPRCMAPEEAVNLVQQLLSGLGAAHRAGLVHRDVKLENLFLCDEGDGHRVLKILDFGVVKVLPFARVEPPGIRTSEGAVVGTPHFIPPEQATGRDVGPPADIYGVGVVLYELLTGYPPFYGVTEFTSLLRAHVAEDPVPPSKNAPQPIEPALEDVVMRALAKRPQDRYTSAEELSLALEQAMQLLRRVGASAAQPGGAPPPAEETARAARRPSAPDARVRGASPLVALLVVMVGVVVSALVALALLRGT
jgi:serine/threonine-protein kinase